MSTRRTQQFWIKYTVRTLYRLVNNFNRLNKLEQLLFTRRSTGRRIANDWSLYTIIR